MSNKHGVHKQIFAAQNIQQNKEREELCENLNPFIWPVKKFNAVE